jgi:hypothetical protein
MLKTCYRCEVEQEETAFGFDHRYTPKRRRHMCTGCCVKANLESRRKNRESYNEKAKVRRIERKKRAIEYKGGKCEHCGLVFPICAFDFHHVNSSEKDRDPGLMMGLTDKKLFLELDKCILLCANCHRVEHFNHGY